MQSSELKPIGDIFVGLWRKEIRFHWVYRKTLWHRTAIRNYVRLLRTRYPKET